MSNTEWQLFTKEIKNKLTLYSLFGSPTSNSLVICKTFTLWTYTLWPMTWLYFLMMNSSKLKAGQDSESQKSYESVLILKVQNEKRFWIQHYYTEFFLLILAESMAWCVGQPEWILNACASTVVLCFSCHCLSNKIFRWKQVWHKARFSALFYFNWVHMSYVCLLYCLHRKICIVVKQDPILSLNFTLMLSVVALLQGPSHFPASW